MTILGSHTVDELQWLLKSRDYFSKTLGKAVAAKQYEWLRTDPAGAAAWGKDYLAFQIRYAVASAEASKVIADAKDKWFGGNWTIAEAAWLKVIRAFQQVDGTTTSGDFTDLIRRARKGGIVVSFPEIPPDVSVDADLAVYKDADAAWNTVQEAANRVTSWGGGFAVGALVALAAILYIGGRR
jgi:hypothetical protein